MAKSYSGHHPLADYCYLITDNFLNEFNMPNKARTVRYVIFYGLFLPDSWQILIGLITAYFLAPLVVIQPDGGLPARMIVFVMIAVIGYAVSRIPARWITRTLIRWLLGDQRP